MNEKASPNSAERPYSLCALIDHLKRNLQQSDFHEIANIIHQTSLQRFDGKKALYTHLTDALGKLHSLKAYDKHAEGGRDGPLRSNAAFLAKVIFSNAPEFYACLRKQIHVQDLPNTVEDLTVLIPAIGPFLPSPPPPLRVYRKDTTPIEALPQRCRVKVENILNEAGITLPVQGLRIVKSWSPEKILALAQILSEYAGASIAPSKLRRLTGFHTITAFNFIEERLDPKPHPDIHLLSAEVR